MNNQRLKMFSAIVMALVLAVNCCGCDWIYRKLQKEGAEEKDLLGEVSPLQSNAKVKEVQKILKLYGYRIGNPDGVLGANTRDAIEAFQRDSQLQQTRFVDQATWERLNVFVDCELIENGDLNTKTIQQALKAAGFNPGKVDGRWGQRTLTAIKNFQKAKGLKPDGKVGFKTLSALARYLSVSR